ncbi:hypothetical protein ABFT23_17925 [Nocardioides sp. C4-1]|uniref:hypothetical protein n=1 Tax=Nocardioides sp. C4-1 TaxID=3151851 RepID=UPI003265644D
MASRARHLWWILGVALVVGGTVAAWTASVEPTEMGWFAYTPLDEGSDWQMTWGDSPAVVVARTRLIGWVIVGSGLVVLATCLGYRLGRRRPVGQA